VKEQIVKHLNSPKLTDLNPDHKSNTGPVLFDIFLWQTVKDYADEQLKKAWTAANEEAVVPTDDRMRETLDRGEDKIVAESNTFSCIVKVTEPRVTFDKDTFLADCAKKFKVPIAKLVGLAKACGKEGKPPLSKRVVEV
jgi:hypothetical protein